MLATRANDRSDKRWWLARGPFACHQGLNRRATCFVSLVSSEAVVGKQMAKFRDGCREAKGGRREASCWQTIHRDFR